MVLLYLCTRKVHWKDGLILPMYKKDSLERWSHYTFVQERITYKNHLEKWLPYTIVQDRFTSEILPEPHKG